MATNTNVTGAQLASMVREEDLEDLEKLLKDLEDSAHKAKDDGRIYMAQQYIVLVANVNSEVHRIRARFKREAIASLRKDTKRLKEEARANAGTE
jgi:hypothetical protein